MFFDKKIWITCSDIYLNRYIIRVANGLQMHQNLHSFCTDFAPILHRCKKIRCNSETIGSNNKLSSSDKMSLQEVTKCHYWTKYA